MAEIDGKTKVVGLFGWPVEHSFSPYLHNTAFRELNLNYTYLPFAVKPTQLKEAVEGIRGLNLSGVNVTIPHKENIMRYLDKIDPAAQLIGAVNTIVNKDGVLIGYNTDGPGFVDSLELEMEIRVKGKRMLLFGAGGAAKAVAIQSALSGLKKLVIVNRNLERARALAHMVAKTGCATEVIGFSEVNAQLVEETDILVNGSPVGMHPDLAVEPIISPLLLHKKLLVCDLIYNPLETVLLAAAKKAGAKTWSGLGMLIHQGALSFEYWTKERAPLEIMRRAMQSFINL